MFKFGPLSSFDSSGNFLDSSFLQNLPKTFNAGLASTLTPRHLRQSIVGGYIQDDWRIRPHLTLNIGVRYEIATVPTETDGKLSNLPTLSSATPHLGSPYFQNPTLRNFDPRIGFAWDPFHNGKTAVRGGFGQFDVLPLLYQYTILSSLAAPFFELGSIHPPAGSFYQGVAPLLTANSLRATYIDPNPKRGYVLQYNLNVQQQLTSTLNGMILTWARVDCTSPSVRMTRTSFFLPSLLPVISIQILSVPATSSTRTTAISELCSTMDGLITMPWNCNSRNA